MGRVSRILMVHASCTTVDWSRDTKEKTKWDVELFIGKPQNVEKANSIAPVAKSMDMKQLEAISTAASIGYDRDGNFSVFVRREDGLFERYRRVLGLP